MPLRQLLERAAGESAPTSAAFCIRPFVHQLDGRQRRGARERIAAERIRMRADRPVHHVLARNRHAHRQPRGDALRGDDDVGLNADVLDREHLPGAADARLHFVGDEQHAVRGSRSAASP